MTVFFCVLHHGAVQNCDRLEESRVSILMATECIEVHNKWIYRKKCAALIQQFAIIWSVVITEGGKGRQFCPQTPIIKKYKIQSFDVG